jgi:TonB family protein
LDIRLLAAVLLSIGCAAAVRAQVAPTAAEQSAMERAQREADGPRRRILEAAKVKGTVRPDGPAVPAPVAAPPAAPAPAPVPAVARREEAAERPPALATLPAAAAPLALPASAVASVPSVSRVELAPASVAMVDMPLAKTLNLPAPRLLSRVDPELPPRLQRRGARRVEVVVALTIGADGTVRDVALPSGTAADLEAAVREALYQWRYEPQPEARQHSVQLVFGPG